MTFAIAMLERVKEYEARALKHACKCHKEDIALGFLSSADKHMGMIIAHKLSLQSVICMIKSIREVQKGDYHG